MGPEWMLRDSLVDILKLLFPWIDVDIFIFVLPTHFRGWLVHMVQVQRAIGKRAHPVGSGTMDAAVAEGYRWLCYWWDVKEHQQSGVSQLLLCPNSCAFNSLHQGALICSCFVSAYKGLNSQRVSSKDKVLYKRQSSFQSCCQVKISSERAVSSWSWNFESSKSLHETITCFRLPMEARMLEIEYDFPHAGAPTFL